MRKQLPQNIISSVVTNVEKMMLSWEKNSSNIVWRDGGLEGVQ